MFCGEKNSSKKGTLEEGGAQSCATTSKFEVEEEWRVNLLAKEVFKVKTRETPDVRHGAEASVAVDQHVLSRRGPPTEAKTIYALCRGMVRATKP